MARNHTVAEMITLARVARDCLYDVRTNITNGTLEKAIGEQAGPAYAIVQSAITDINELIKFLQTTED